MLDTSLTMDDGTAEEDTASTTMLFASEDAVIAMDETVDDASSTVEDGTTEITVLVSSTTLLVMGMTEDSADDTTALDVSTSVVDRLSTTDEDISWLDCVLDTWSSTLLALAS
jgi:hypothetical protein